MKPTPSVKALDRGNELARIQSRAQALARRDGAEHITAAWVRVKIADAVDTQRRIGGGKDLPPGAGSSMPQALRTLLETVDREKLIRAPPPNAAAISLSDAVMVWLTLVPGIFERRLIVLRASNYTWREIAGIMAKSVKTCRYWEDVAAIRLAALLAGEPDPFASRAARGRPGRPPAGRW